jgi:hypothetical protein
MYFENLFLISVRNVDLPTGLNIVNSISKEFNVHSIFIKRVWETSHPPLIKGGKSNILQIFDLMGVAYA